MEQKFTQMAQEALSDAVQNAAALGNPQVDTLHLLDAMLRQENSMARALIEAAGGNAQNVSAEVHQAMQSLPRAAVRALRSLSAVRPFFSKMSAL